MRKRKRKAKKMGRKGRTESVGGRKRERKKAEGREEGRKGKLLLITLFYM